eukprot:gene4457-7832_t
MNNNSMKTYKTNTGGNFLHSAAASNSFELLTLLVQKYPQLIHTKDNYGRTPLFWSFWSGGILCSTFLLSQGARIFEQDEVGDSPLHISSQTEKYESTKQILFWMLNNDAEYRSQAKLILHALYLKNNSGNTPIDISEKKKDIKMVKLYQAIEEICKEKLKLVEEWVFVKEIIIRSGPFNGKEISKLDNTVSAVRLNFDEENLILDCFRNNGNDLKCKMNLTKIAYLILERSQLNVEITLSESPEVSCLVDGKWTKMTNSVFSSGLSFHCNLEKIEDLEKTNKYLFDKGIMNQFQEYCFCYVPTGGSNSTSKNTTETKQSNVSKMSVLRKKFNTMSLKNSPVLKSTTSNTSTILNNENTQTKTNTKIL